MEGCLVSQVCESGSCVDSQKASHLQSKEYPYCLGDADCPDWQACLQGRCYSNCTSDTQCNNGKTCYKYVCRSSCKLTNPECDSGTTCQNVGSTDDKGVCLPVAKRRHDSSSRTQTQEVFTLVTRQIELNNRNKEGWFGIQNNNKFETVVEISRLSDTTGATKPLSWLSFDLCKTYSDDRQTCIDFTGKLSSKEPYSITLPPNSNMIVKVVGAEKSSSAQTGYSGMLRVKSSQTSQDLGLSYRYSGTGRWKGKLYSFGNFEDTNITNLRSSSLAVRDLKNALLRHWLGFKRNELTYEQFDAILQSIRNGTWQSAEVQKRCATLFSKTATNDVVCYPSSSKDGLDILSFSNREAPVPSGVSSLDFAIDVKASGNTWQGRVVTSETLHYPGNPEITIQFTDTPGVKVLSLLSSLSATSDLGGRYRTTDGNCISSNFIKVTTPSLIPGFQLGTTERSGSLLRDQTECRSKNAPQSIPAQATAEQKGLIEQTNLSLSAANPIPNGRVLRRKLEFLDGVLYQNNILFVLVRERFTSPFASTNNAGQGALTQDWYRYGYLLLQHVPTEVSDDDFKGGKPLQCSGNGDCSSGETCDAGVCQPASQSKQVSCSPEIVKLAMNQVISQQSDLKRWSRSDLSDLVGALMGQQASKIQNNQSMQIHRTVGKNTPYEYTYTNTQGQRRYIHYLCLGNGQFNGGPIDDAKDCPLGSKVIFFESDVDEATMRGHSCQKSNSCNLRLSQLQTTSTFRGDIVYRCVDTNRALCTDNRKDLREGKVFFKPSTVSNFVSPLNPLRIALFDAFRYRLKFQSRQGTNLGFTPTICNSITGSQSPYCYTPATVERIEQRVNCLESILSDPTLYKSLETSMQGQLRSFLAHAFSYSNTTVNGAVVTEPGFETLNAELRVMLGDEAYTLALTSRYNLAATNLLTFEGDQLEPNGIRISGVLGYEMYQLYLSAQYYQSVLDRFYAQTETLAASFRESNTSFLTTASVSSYIKKLLLAATRKARSWSQIAKKYQEMNRSDLARHVLERAYVSSYVEQLVMTQLLHKMQSVLDSKQLPQLRTDIQSIMLTYNSSLLSMQSTYQQVKQNLNSFGLPEGYIPFPAVGFRGVSTNSTNAFQLAIQFAKEKLAIADAKEQIALQTSRSFDTDSARFQSELVKIENNYNNQLIQLCGELKDGNQSVPAIPQYAHLAKAGKVVDPCGRVQGSALYDAYLNLEQVALESQQLEQQKQTLFARIDNEEKRIKKFCNDRFSLAQITWDTQDKKNNLMLRRSNSDMIQQSVTRFSMGAIQIAQGWKCELLLGLSNGTSCMNATISNALRIGILIGQEAAITSLNIKINNNKKEIAEMQRDFSKTSIQTACTICPPDKPDCQQDGVARLASQNYLTQLTMELVSFELRALQLEYTVRQALAHIQSIRQQVQRLIQDRQDNIGLLTQINAASNDPNQRIYKNDAVISAERTFEEAIREAYRATLVFEYYSGQSYSRKGDLYLVRMITKGDISLESYLSQLERAYLDFEEQSGKPDLRVLVLSLRDDILKVPHVDESGKPLGLQERILELQKQLNDRQNFDKDGFLSIPFAVSVGGKSSHVSPVTFNHKVAYVEAEIKATERGDSIGRVYLKQSGTGVVRHANNSFQYYTLPTRTAVINSYFNGHKTFEPSVYQNYRLLDRPLGNTQWVLQFNQASEKSNQDIELNSINDIVLYIYYKDFSQR